MEAKTVLAIDPGSGKCGVAVVRREEDGRIRLLWHAVVPREDLCATLQRAHEEHPYHMVVVGNGTTSRPLVEEIRSELPSMGILVIDEKDTTLQARERYWEHNSRFGWRRFVPSTLQVPPKPYDDFVALILAERVLQP